ncbi:hypothetical protein P7D22_05990 [Lichenihabitans sp. Uapishka_5]|uniref:hypothetical protein n=1 Tax=Lichenihabitans sp. Uapishka_5 TaxID=3037302 RepID=UPI0029E81416|nr:hypothetical protein [Lichenihabitans sp. Uapishka_5]MDX7950729.1 hypothetical protein [Lichenihabitans sp. Uapishka_5]
MRGGGASIRVVTAGIAGALGLALAACAPVASRPEATGMISDPIAPTVPRSFAADLPRSPLADVVVNGGLRFSTAAAAQRRCPDDAVVRVDTASNIYRPATTPGPGVFMCKAAAMQEGDRPR